MTTPSTPTARYAFGARVPYDHAGAVSRVRDTLRPVADEARARIERALNALGDRPR